MLDFQGVFCMSAFYNFAMALIGFACITLGWDSINGVPLFQLALVFGGAVIGHVLTEALNQPEE
jgi:vancomycin permeability regulator SanA